MKRASIAVTAFVVTAVVFSAGCRSTQQPTRTGGEPETAADAPVMQDPGQRMSELRQRLGDLQALVARMPGQNSAQDRQLTAEAFEKTTGALELLAGPNPPGAFRQQLRIIENTRTFLTSGGEGTPTDPSIDSGLRSVHRALVNVRERLFPDDQKVQQPLDVLAARLSELDAVRGPLHALVTAQAFEAVAQTMGTMAQTVEGRVANSAPGNPAVPAAK